MGKKLRRFLSVFLSIAMVLGYIPCTGITAYAETVPVSATELVADASWQDNPYYLTPDDLENFKEIARDKAMAWEDAPQSGYAYLIYDIECEWEDEEIGGYLKNVEVFYIVFFDGHYDSYGSLDGCSHVNVYEGENSYNIRIFYTTGETTTYSVTLAGGTNATADPETGSSQTVTAGSDMTTVTYTASEGYKFPAFEDITNNGITATRTSDTVVTVSGTPTADASITIPDAVADNQPLPLSVTELVIPDNWEYRYDYLKSGDLEGLVSSTQDKAAAWTGAPGSGFAYLIYDITDSGVSYCVFEAGRFKSANNNIQIQHQEWWYLKTYNKYKFFYTTGGSAVASVDVNGVSLEPATAQTIDVDDKVAFTATITPDEATNTSVKWSVGGTNADAVTLYSDEDCTQPIGSDATETLTVYAKGVSAGTATVTATATNGTEDIADDQTASCEVTVNAANQPLTVTEFTVPESWANEFHGLTAAYFDGFVERTPEEASAWTDAPKDDDAFLIYKIKDGKAYYCYYTAGGFIKSDHVVDYADVYSVSEVYKCKFYYTSDGSATQISRNVTFKVVNGSWNDETTDDKTVTLTGVAGATLKLSDTDIPAVGSKPTEGYKAGSWDVTPDTATEITEDTTYTYTYAAKTAAEVTVVPTAKELTYNGSEQELVTAGTVSGGTMQYAIGTNGTTAPTEGWTADIPTAKNAGTYYVWYKAFGDDNHLDSESKCVEVKINAKTVTVDGITASDKVYDGSTSATLDYSQAVLNGNLDGNNLTVSATGTFTSKDASASAQTVTISRITFGGTAAGNYELATTGNQTDTTATITPKEVSLNWGTTELTYNGKPQAPTCTAGNLVGTDSCTVTVEVTGEHTVVGEYTAQATGLSNPNYKLPTTTTKSFSIKRATITPSVTVGSWTYGATRNTPTVKGNTGNGAVTFTWKKKDAPDTDYKAYDDSNAPTEAGAYVLKADIAQTTNYEAGSATVNFTISQADMGISVSMEDWTYGGTASTPEVSGYDNSKVTFMYKKNGAKDSTYSAKKPSTAGSWVVKAIPSDSNIAPATDNFTINKKILKLFWYPLDGDRIYYDGTDKCPVVYITNGEVRDDVAAIVVGEGYAIGKHKARIVGLTGDGAENYQLPVDDEDNPTIITYEIVKGYISPSISIEGWTYGDTPNAPKVYDNTEGGNVTYEYKVKGVSDNTYTTKVPTDAGEYTVRATIAETANYEDATTTCDFDISPRVVTFNWSSDSFTYNGEGQAPEADVTNLVKGDKVEFTYSYDDDNTADAKPVNAGNYIAKVVGLSGTDAGNYKLPQNPASKSFEIATAELKMTADDMTIEYGSNVPTYTAKFDGFVGNDTKDDLGGTLTFTCDYTNTSPDGTYTITPSGLTSNNYSINFVNGVLTVTAATAKITTAPAGVEGLEYNASDLPLITPGDATGGTICYRVNNGNWQETIPTGINAGTYKVEWYLKAASGYSSDSSAENPAGEVEVTIQKKELSLEWDNYEGITYDGKPHKPTATVTGTQGQDTLEVTVSGENAKAGIHIATAKISGEAAVNYILPGDATQKFTIEKRKVELKWTLGTTEWPNEDDPPTILSIDYDAADHCPTAQVVNKVDGDVVNVKVIGASTAVGKHTAEATKLTGTDAANYILPEDAEVTFEILKSGNYTPTVTIEDWTYGDTASIPVVEGNVEGANVTYKYKKKNAEDSTYTDKVPTKVGDYTIKATIAATAGYSEKNVYDDFSILPKKVDLVWTSETEFTYSGNSQAPEANVINPVYGDKVSFTYNYKKSDDPDTAYSKEMPVNAGSYIVKIVGLDGANASNYVLPEEGLTMEFVINPKTVDLEWSDDYFDYSGEPQAPEATITNYVDEDVVEVGGYKYRVDEEGSEYSNVKPSDAGSYVAKATSLSGEDAANYILPEDATQEFCIETESINPVIEMDDWTYGDTAKVPVVTGNKGNATETFVYYTDAECTTKTTTANSGAASEGAVPKFAGEYTVKVTIAPIGKYEGGEATCNFSIYQKEVEIQWSNLEFTYDAKGHIPTAEAVKLVEGDNLTVTVTGEQINAGEYTAEVSEISGDAKDNYVIPDDAYASFVINEKPITLTWTLGNTTWPDKDNPNAILSTVYNAKDQCPEVTLVGIEDADKENVSAKVVGAATAVGVHTAEVTKLLGNAAGNYVLPEETEAKFKIVKAELDNAKIVLDDWTYGNSPNVPEIDGNIEGGNVTYMYKAADAAESEYTSTVPSLAGDYMVKAIISATAGYEGKTLEKAFKIEKRPLELVLTLEGWTYGEESNEPELTGNMENGKETYTYYVDSECNEVTTKANSGAESDGAKPVNAGTYTLKASVETTANYLAGKTTVEFTIEQRTLTIIADAQTKVYGEDDPEFTYTQEGLVEGDEITGTLSRVEGSDVGTYDITLGTLTAGNNYAIAYTGAVLSITEADSVITTAPEAVDLTYDGEEHDLITAGEAEGGTLMYAVGTDAEKAPDEADFKEEVPAKTNTDVYYVWYMVEGDKNHFDVEAECITAEIKEVDKTDLNKAIDGSEKLLESMEGNDDYNDIAEALTEALEDAKEIAEDKNVTEETVQTATEDIEEALEEATADKLVVDKDNFDEAKEAAKKAADNAAKSGDSAASKKLVTDAKTAIDNLKYDESKTPEENQKAVDDIITKLEGKLKEQRSAEKRAAEEAADTKAAGNVVNMINNLPAPDKITKNDKGAIEAARNAYNALTAQQKAKVNEQTLAKLANAEKALANASKYSGEWINGQWYETDGSANYAPKGEWKNNGTGWWYEDTAGWYPKSQWQKIDGKWYYFTADGYMDYSEYRDGYWLGSDGAWVEAYYGGKWMSKWENGAAGWWYTDASGWYPQNQYLWIDGVQYWFNENGITN